MSNRSIKHPLFVNAILLNLSSLKTKPIHYTTNRNNNFFTWAKLFFGIKPCNVTLHSLYFVHFVIVPQVLHKANAVVLQIVVLLSLLKFVHAAMLVSFQSCTVISLRPVYLGRLLPTDISHRIICYGSVSRSDQSLTKRSHHVSQVYTLFSGLENSQCLGPPKVRKPLDVQLQCWSSTVHGGNDAWFSLWPKWTAN